jgi:hypothetical protein
VNLRIALKYLLAVGVLFACPWVHSQSADCLSRSTVITVVGPRDKNGASPIASLSPEDLRGKLGGKSVSIESVAPPSKPLRVSIVLDIGSAQTKLTWDATRLIIHNFPSHFSEGSEFSLVAFDDRVEQNAPLQRGAHALDEFVDALSPSKTKESKTGLYEALAAGIRTLGTPQLGDAVFLVTAWEDAGESDKQRATVQWLSAVGVRLFGISFDFSRLPGVPPTGAFVSITSFAPIESAARISGGLWTRSPASGPALDMLLKASASVMADFYALGLKLAQPLVKAKEMRIELVKGGKISLKPNLSLKDVVLSYPQSLYPCR